MYIPVIDIDTCHIHIPLPPSQVCLRATPKRSAQRGPAKQGWFLGMWVISSNWVWTKKNTKDPFVCLRIPGFSAKNI